MDSIQDLRNENKSLKAENNYLSTTNMILMKEKGALAQKVDELKAQVVDLQEDLDLLRDLRSGL